jgi:hypothetical protein
MPCPQAGNPQQAQQNGICSWMLDPLAANPTTRNGFLQCQPAAFSLYCGRWQCMPCSPQTIFDVNLQVCVWDPSRWQEWREGIMNECRCGARPVAAAHTGPDDHSADNCAAGSGLWLFDGHEHWLVRHQLQLPRHVTMPGTYRSIHAPTISH